MKKRRSDPVDVDNLNVKLRSWRKRHNTPAKVAAAHRKVILERVVQSMSFENQLVSMARLKTLLKKKKTPVG